MNILKSILLSSAIISTSFGADMNPKKVEVPAESPTSDAPKRNAVYEMRLNASLDKMVEFFRENERLIQFVPLTGNKEYFSVVETLLQGMTPEDQKQLKEDLTALEPVAEAVHRDLMGYIEGKLEEFEPYKSKTNQQHGVQIQSLLNITSRIHQTLDILLLMDCERRYPDAYNAANNAIASATSYIAALLERKGSTTPFSLEELALAHKNLSEVAEKVTTEKVSSALKRLSDLRTTIETLKSL